MMKKRCCDVHATNVFDEAKRVTRLSADERDAWFRRVSRYTPTRHALRRVAKEVVHGKTIAGKRNVYRITSSSSARSLEKRYLEILDHETRDNTECWIDNDQHVSSGIRSNFTRGDSVDFRRENARYSGCEIRWLVESDDDDDDDEEDDDGADFNVRIAMRLDGRYHMRLLDFAFANGGECWNLWCHVLGQVLDVHDETRMWPRGDSVTRVAVLVERPGSNDESYRFVHEHGLVTKLSPRLVSFVRAYRRLMRHTVIACCFAVRRAGGRLRTAYTKRHECTFPAMSQNVYVELFLTTGIGHDLLCLRRLKSHDDGVEFLRETMRALKNVVSVRPNLSSVHDRLASRVARIERRDTVGVDGDDDTEDDSAFVRLLRRSEEHEEEKREGEEDR